MLFIPALGQPYGIFISHCSNCDKEPAVRRHCCTSSLLVAGYGVGILVSPKQAADRAFIGGGLR